VTKSPASGILLQKSEILTVKEALETKNNILLQKFSEAFRFFSKNKYILLKHI